MIFLEALETARDLGRLQEIARVLVRHGLGDLVRRLGLAHVLERTGRVLHWEGAQRLVETPGPAHLRLAFEELGPTFVKLGQLMAGREDLFGPVWTKELAQLRERAAHVPFEQVRAQLEEDLGAPPEDCLARFEREPLAAASIAQVYRAQLKTGEEVVLKVRRPGIREAVEADLRLLKHFAERVEAELPELRRFRPRLFIRHFARSLRDELDLRFEARHAQRMAIELAECEGVATPRVFDRYTRERLLVLEYVQGQSLGALFDGEGLEPDQGARIARQGTDAYLHMVFEAGFYHADPHPGNLILRPDGTVVLIDFGLVGFLTNARRRELFDLLHAAVMRDEEGVVDVLSIWSQGSVLDPGLLQDDCAAFLDRHLAASMEGLDLGRMLQEIATLVRENNLYLPPDIAGLIKLLVMLDSLGLALDPTFVLARQVEPFVRRQVLRRRSPRRALVSGMRELAWIAQGLPGDARRILGSMRRGRFHLEVDVRELERLGTSLERGATRLTLGLVTAALIVGTAVALQIPFGPRLFDLPIFGLIGFLSSLVVGFWVLWSILRSGRS